VVAAERFRFTVTFAIDFLPNYRSRRSVSQAALSNKPLPKLNYKAADDPTSNCAVLIEKGMNKNKQVKQACSITLVSLALRILRRFAGTLETVLLTLFDAGVAGQQALLTQQGLELFVGCYQSPRDAVSNGLRLAGNTATSHLDFNIEFAHSISSLEWMLDIAAMLEAREIFLVLFAIDDNLPLT